MKRRQESQFLNPPVRNPEDLTNEQAKTLLAFASASSVETVMKNHFFTINGRIYKQKDGCPIGMDLSVELASLCMTFWDQKFLKKLKSLGLKVDVYKWYVDDIFMILPEISPGWFFNKESRKL